MTESNGEPAAPNAWLQALKGKTGATPVAVASKKMFLVLSGGFFVCFCFLYMIYNVRHAQTGAQSGANVQAIPAGIHMQPGMMQPVSMQPQATMNQFGAPRSDSGLPPGAGMAGMNSMSGSPMAMASPPAAMQGAPYGQAQYGGTAGMYQPAAYTTPHMPYPQHQRSDLVITAPRQFRHAIPTVGPGGQPEPINQRHRTYAAR